MPYHDNDTETIKELAAIEELLPLRSFEYRYIRACQQYNWYAVEPQMPGGIPQERALALKYLKQYVDSERVDQLDRFIEKYWSEDE